MTRHAVQALTESRQMDSDSQDFDNCTFQLRLRLQRARGVRCAKHEEEERLMMCEVERAREA